MRMARLHLLFAVRNKSIRFRAWALDSYKQTLLQLKNEGSTEFQLDVSKSGLTAKTGKSQTIGLSHPVESGPGDHILVLKPGEEREIVFNSRCLNRSEKPPENGTEYDLIPTLLADDVAELLRKGVDQYEVWDAMENPKSNIKVNSAIPAMVDKFEPH
jgi:hypothetical protein